MAKELATAGFRVVVLEQGPWLHEQGLPAPWRSPVATEVTPASTCYRAAEYHQRYPEKPGLASCHIP